MATDDRGQEFVAPSAVEGSTRPSGAHAPASAAKIQSSDPADGVRASAGSDHRTSGVGTVTKGSEPTVFGGGPQGPVAPKGAPVGSDAAHQRFWAVRRYGVRAWLWSLFYRWRWRDEA